MSGWFDVLGAGCHDGASSPIEGGTVAEGAKGLVDEAKGVLVGDKDDKTDGA